MESKKKRLTQARLKEVLDYNPETGIFYWKEDKSRRLKAGYAAGSIKSSGGYVRIGIDKKKYQAHRLAFLWMEGYFPENEIDHIDRIKTNNQWLNLREVSRQCNARNASVSDRNTSGVVGVSFIKNTGKWKAQIGVNNADIFIGYFNNKKDAVLARWNAELGHKFPNCCATSASYKFLKDNNLL